MLGRATKGPLDVVKAVCHVACRWKDAALWARAVRACCTTQGVALLPKDDVLTALEIFDLKPIESEYVLADVAVFPLLTHYIDWSSCSKVISIMQRESSSSTILINGLRLYLILLEGNR